jgi:Phosphoenolpyruvate carboxylase (EC 4.1.1.31)
MTKTVRRADPLRQIERLPRDAALREDVRHLGAVVGEMLAEQLGPPFLDQVEAIRTAAIRRREEERAPETLARLLWGLPTERAEQLTRAFSTYFQAVNVAERVHRIRRRREYQRESDAPQPESLRDSLDKLRGDGVGALEIKAMIGRMDIEPVFTAHPTEAVRRSLLDKERDIVRCLVNDLDGSRTPMERRADWERLRMSLTAGWQTSEVAPVRPAVQDELEHVSYYLSGPLYQVVPVFYELFEEAIREVYGDGLELPRLLRFATWVGGDMDGNPNVGADTILATLEDQRRQVIERYESEVGVLLRALSQTECRAHFDEALMARIAEYRECCPAVAARIARVMPTCPTGCS